MTTYAVTGASGHLGAAAVAALRRRAIAAGDVVALVRTPEQVASLAEEGVQVRHFDLDDPTDHAAALAGVDRLLLVSSTAIGQRERQHGAAIDAAVAAGVRRLVYTSFIGAQDHAEDPLTPEHKITEAQLAASGLDEVVVLRNGYYMENLLGQLDQVLETGVLVGASGDGRISAASRDDLAEAAAVALIDDKVTPGAYDLVGPALTKAQIADELSAGSGREVRYEQVELSDFQAGMEQAGMPEQQAAFYAEVERATAGGAMYSDSTALRDLLGREPITLAEATRRIVG